MNMSNPLEEETVKRKTALILTVGLLVSALALLAACGSGTPTSDTARIDKLKKIRIAIHDNNMPFEAGSGTGVDGFDVDLMYEIAKELGDYKLEWNRVPEFNKCFEVLKAGGADIIINAVSITEERKKEYDFSVPYFDTGIRIAVKFASPVQSAADLKGKKIGVEKDSTSEKYVKENFPDAKIFPVNSIEEAMNTNLSQDEIDAVIGDEPPLQYIINSSGDDQFRLVGERLSSEQYGIVLKKGSDLKAKIDQAITKLKSAGKLEELKTKWKLFDKPPSAGEAATATATPAQ